MREFRLQPLPTLKETLFIRVQSQIIERQPFILSGPEALLQMSFLGHPHAGHVGPVGHVGYAGGVFEGMGDGGDEGRWGHTLFTFGK